MKKILIYSAILIAGLFLGYLFFGNSSEEKTSDPVHDQEGAVTTMWTCSMHPQIMQPEPGDCPICGMDLIPAESGTDGLAANEFSMTENAMKLANIQTTVVGKGKGVDGKIILSGKIEINDDNKASMPAHFDGRVEKLYVNTVGDKVSVGQTIASVYSPELVAAQQELITAVKLKNSQPGLYNAVRNKFKNWKISGSLLDEIESSGNVRTSWPIYSHVTGTVTEIMVEEGAHIMDGMPIFKVSNLNSVWAVFDAYESQIANLQEGQALDILVNALRNEKLSGKISFIDPVLNTDSRTVEVRVVLNNTNSKLKPGMFVRAEVEASSDSNIQTLEVPRSAVMWTGERSLVYVKTSETEPIFKMREVTLGNETGETYQILNGLESGDEVVTNGTFTVDAAAQLQGKNSMMSQGEIKEVSPGMKMKLPDIFQKDFTKVLSKYFELKDAFVNTNVEAAKDSAQEMLQQLESLETSNLGAMETQHLNKIKSMLEAISENDNIENQRDHFMVLSENMIAFASNMHKLDKAVYIQHCPMANGNKGADWLSLSSEIRNPYFGEKMLNCGDTQREL